MKIHLVDDNIDITNMLKIYFEKKGHECSVSTDGRSALPILLNQKFDVVLLDVALPEFSGRDIIDSLYENNKMLQSNIVILSASTLEDDQNEIFMNKGVRGVLKKPMDPDDILDYLLQYIVK